MIYIHKCPSDINGNSFNSDVIQSHYSLNVQLYAVITLFQYLILFGQFQDTVRPNDINLARSLNHTILINWSGDLNLRFALLLRSLHQALYVVYTDMHFHRQ